MALCLETAIRAHPHLPRALPAALHCTPGAWGFQLEPSFRSRADAFGRAQPVSRARASGAAEQPAGSTHPAQSYIRPAVRARGIVIASSTTHARRQRPSMHRSTPLHRDIAAAFDSSKAVDAYETSFIAPARAPPASERHTSLPLSRCCLRDPDCADAHMHTGKGYTYIDNRSRASCSHWAVFSLMQLGDMLFNGAAPNSIGAPPLHPPAISSPWAGHPWHRVPFRTHLVVVRV